MREYISGRRCRIRWSASVAFSAFSFAPPRRPLCIFVVVSTFPTLDRREPLTALSSCNTKGKRESAEGGRIQTRRGQERQDAAAAALGRVASVVVTPRFSLVWSAQFVGCPFRCASTLQPPTTSIRSEPGNFVWVLDVFTPPPSKFGHSVGTSKTFRDFL